MRRVRNRTRRKGRRGRRPDHGGLFNRTGEHGEILAVLIRRDMPLFGARQSSVAAEPPFRLGPAGGPVAVASWRRPRLPSASLASAALHAAVAGLLILLARPAPLSPAAEQHGVTMLFEPAPAPAPPAPSPAASPEPAMPAPPSKQAPLPEHPPPMVAHTETVPQQPPVPPAAEQAEDHASAQPVAPTENMAEALPLPLPLPPPPAPSPPALPRPIAHARAVPPALAPISPAPPPEPTTAPPPFEATAAQHIQVISGAWRRSLEAWLSSHKTYPEAARRRGEEGAVTLRFTVESSGLVTSVAAVRGSGSERLDTAAVSMLRGATLPPFDPTMPEQELTATVQVRYALEQ